MKQSLSLLALIFFFSLQASAQTVVDYRSNAATFNWDVDASWLRWNGSAWADPTTGGFGYPGENATGIAGTVTIQNGHTVRAVTDVTTNDIGNLVLAGSGILSFNTNGVDIEATGNLSMDGTSQIQGTNANRTLRIGGTFTVPASATNARIEGITLTVVGATTISGALTFNNGTGVKTLNNDLTIANGGNFTLTNNNHVVNIGGSVSLLGNGIFNMNSGSQDVNITGNLTLDGTSQLQGNGSSRDITVGGTFTIPLSATNARIAGMTFTVNGATSVIGTVVFNNDNGVKTFRGSVTVSGSWTSTAITTDDNLVFGGEVMTSGTFACGCN